MSTTEDQKVTKKAVAGKIGWKEFIYRLFFTRDDSLDMLQLLFVAIIIVTLYVVCWTFVIAPIMSDAVRIEALLTLRWLAGLLVLTAVPTWLVPAFTKILSKGKFDPSTPKADSEATSTEGTYNVEQNPHVQ